MHRPVRTAVVETHEVDGAGVCAVLARFVERVRLVDLPPRPPGEVDVVLYGVRERHPGHDPALHSLVRRLHATVIVLGWGPEAPQVEWALACGAHGRLHKTMTGEEIVAGIEAIHLSRDPAAAPPLDGHCHPGVRAARLTPRELQALQLITRGLTNQEIADRVYVSINSVKTYIRTAYRKIGVTRRSQAVSWGVQHGLDVAEDATVQVSVV